MPQTGDIVRFLNATGGGRITRINGNLAYVEDQDGFETPVLLREVVVVQTAAQAAAAKVPSTATTARTTVRTAPPAPEAVQTPAPVQTSAPVDKLDTSETAEGDVLNVTLGFEALDVKHLSTTQYEASLVNDSNYYLYFTVLSRADNETAWTTRYDGLVEPNIQVTIGQYSSSDVATFDRLAVQLIAFKRQRAAALKPAVSREFKLDTTEFFKLHCFKKHPYFDLPVLAFDVVRDDNADEAEATDALAAAAAKQADNGQQAILARNLSRSLNAKIRADRRQSRQPRQRVNSTEPLEVDLHITELVDNTAGLSPADMLNLQIDTFRHIMDANLHNHGRRIVFIHGKGEGVLRQALTKELNHRYKGHDVQDASFAQYGFGATQVTIR